MLMLGILIYALLRIAGHYYVEGVGYSTIQAILNGDMQLPALLFILFAAKLLATSLSLGSGASGGIFSPSLFMGATIGGAFGVAGHARSIQSRASPRSPAPSSAWRRWSAAAPARQ